MSWHKWLFENLLVLTNLYQLVVVVGLLLLALPLSVWLTRRVVVPRVRAYVPDESELATLERKIDRVVGALVAVVLLGLANLIAEKNQFSHQIISVAFELTLAWMIIRVLTAFLFAEYWAKLMAVIVWTVVALDIAQFLHPIISLLDRVGVTLQGQRLTPWLLIKAGVLLLLFFPLANILIGFLEGKIKLGLQKVVANLVSGYILLMDNSIRPGDVIEVEEVYGWIESLNARYVSVITRDGTAYLVPNEQLMSNMVINWSFSERGLRLKIPVGISYGSDVRRAMELMVEVAAKFPRVLQNPQPVARLIRFGDSSVELELRAWIKDPQRGVVNIKSDIQLSIWDAFHENDIAFPF
ncbi:MAG: mechanosensitive ion channel, partial [Syntrophobacterales bacterium]